MNSDNIMSKINDILSDPKSRESIQEMIGGVPSQKSTIDAFCPENIQRISQLMTDNSDPKINLLYALKPYMSSQRGQQIDNAIKMLRMTKLTGFFKDYN